MGWWRSSCGQVKLVTEFEAGDTTEVEAARFDEHAGLADLGLRLEKPSTSLASGSLAMVSWYLIERPLLRDLRLQQVARETLRFMLPFDRCCEDLVIRVLHANNT